MVRMKKETNSFNRKIKPNFIYRDEAGKFDLSFKLQSLDAKLLIGNYLSHARLKLVRLTQKDVAKGTGVSVRNLINIEAGYGTSMDATMRIYLFYVGIGVLSGEKQGQFSEICRRMWVDKCL